MALYHFTNTPHAKGRNGQKINTRAHYDYICRQGLYAKIKGKEEDLVFSMSGNMPEWAEKPGDFWEAAEENRRTNGRAYREIRLGLQEELSLEDNIALVEEFLEKSGIGENHAFSYAIHDKVAAFDEEHRNIHCHLMFSEKIIEKDRPLDRDMYFKQYSVNQYGEACSGYLADRYYQSQKGTVEMRQMWADIVNRKFKELGIDKEISEKTLSAQREELLSQGKLEEAEKLNRIPAPHLGEAYKNPKTLERIREKVAEIDRQTAYPGCSEDEAEATDNQDSIMEQKIVFFATDKLLRRIVKEIEKEEIRLRQLEIMEAEARRAEMEDEEQAEEIENEPIVITSNDVYINLKIKAREEATKQAENLALYKQTKEKIIPERLFRNIAIERIIGPDYHNLKKRYQRVLEELIPMEKEDYELRNVPFKERREQYIAYSNKLRQKLDMEDQINAYNEELKARESDIQAIVAELTEENVKIEAKAKDIYKDVIKAKKMEKVYLEKANELKENLPDSETVLYSRKMPPLVMRECKLNGITLLHDLPVKAQSNCAYVLLEDISKNDGPKKMTALLLGDTVKKGKADIYVVTINTDGQITGATKTDKKACLYGSAKQTMINSKGKHYLPNAQTAHTQRSSEITGKINQFIEKALSDGKGRYDAWWDDEEERHKKKDELQRVEAEMYRCWSM